MKLKATLTEIDPRLNRLNSQRLTQSDVKEYCELLKQNREAPPVLVAKGKSGIFVLDGFHRLAAASTVGKKKIKAWIISLSAMNRLLKAKFYGTVPSYYGELDNYIYCDGCRYKRY